MEEANVARCMNINTNTQWNVSGRETKKRQMYVSKCGRLIKKLMIPNKTNNKRFQNEVDILNMIMRLKLPGLQQIVEYGMEQDRPYIISINHGSSIKKSNCPHDLHDQLQHINSSLEKLTQYDMYHNDVLVRNFMVRSNTVTLIDFDLGTTNGPSSRTIRDYTFNTCERVLNTFL